MTRIWSLAEPVPRSSLFHPDGPVGLQGLDWGHLRRRVWQQVSTCCVANSGSQHDFRLLFVVLKGNQKDAPAILEGYTSKWAFKQVAAIPEGHFGSRSPCARPERTKGCLTNIAGPQLELCQGKQKKLHTIWAPLCFTCTTPTDAIESQLLHDVCFPYPKETGYGTFIWLASS